MTLFRWMNSLDLENLDCETILESPCVSLVNATTFAKACKLDGSKMFQFDWSSPELCARSANLTFESDPVDLEGIPEDYHDFADVFSKVKVDMLVPHCFGI